MQQLAPWLLLVELTLLVQVESVMSQSELIFLLPANQEATGSLLAPAVVSPESSNVQPYQETYSLYIKTNKEVT
jgi:hypothetical protein